MSSRRLQGRSKRALRTRKLVSSKKGRVNKGAVLLGPRAASVYSGPANYSAARQYMRGLTAFPATRFVQFKYCEDVIISSLTATPNAGNEYVFRLNGLHDPNATGTGHQPYLYDQMTNVYKRYRVYRCQVRLTFYFPNSETMWTAWQIRNSSDSSTLTAATSDQILERTGTGWAPVAPNSNNTITFADDIWINKLEGMSYNEWLGDDKYESLVGTNPQNFPVIAFAAGDNQAPTSASSITVKVQLVYHTRLYEPQTQAQS